VSKVVAIVASHNSMSVDTNAEAAPMRVNCGVFRSLSTTGLALDNFEPPMFVNHQTSVFCEFGQ
jgi:hypothetical protein